MKLMIACVIGGGVLFVVLLVAGVVGLFEAGAYSHCREAEQTLGIATHWSPVNGCRATILGTEVQV